MVDPLIERLRHERTVFGKWSMAEVNAGRRPDIDRFYEKYPSFAGAPGNTSYGLKDSGKREEFSTGAVRDTRDGKGLFSHITLEGARRLAKTTEAGAAKYSPRNWEKGMPVERCLDSALRHIFQYLDGWNDEDHLGAAFWNLMAAVTMEERAEAGKLPKDLLLESRQTYVDHSEGED